MRKHSGLSTVVGAVFLVAVVVTSLSYVTYSMNTLGNFSESLIIEETRQKDQQEEQMEIVSVDITSQNKLDAIVKNSGEIPLKVTSLWIDEQDVNDEVRKIIVNQTISPGDTINLYPTVDFDMDTTKGYNMKLITARGDVQSFYVNSPSSQSLLLNIHAVPEYVPTEFSTTILFTVVNNMSSNNVLYNLTPELNATAVGAATITELSGPTPTSYPSLSPGEIATFEYVYQLTGDADEGASFNATITNAVSGNFVTTTATIKQVTMATQAGTALESFGLSTSLVTEETVLYAHDETDLTAQSGYQLDGSDPSGTGTTGNPRTAPMIFWGPNVTSSLVVTNGTWDGVLPYYNGLVPPNIASPSFAFMFECDDCGGTGSTSESTGNFTSDDFDDQGTGGPTWHSAGGPDDDGYFSYDGNDYHSAEWGADSEYTTHQSIEANTVSTAVWFKIINTTDNFMPIIRWGDENDGSDDEYEITLGDKTAPNNGKIVYRYTTDLDSDETKCISSSAYDDNQWHMALGVRPTDDDCDLYVDGVLVDGTPECNGCGGSSQVGVSGTNSVFIGFDGDTEYLTGDVGMVMHWNYANVGAKAYDLYQTNYGANGTRPYFTLQRTTGGGTVQETIYNGTFNLPFHDPAVNSDSTRYNLSTVTTPDSTVLKYSFDNFTTTTLINSTFAIDERLQYAISWNSDTQNLPIYIRFDDDDASFSLPDESSYLQTPPTTPEWPTYLTFDKDDQVTYYAFNNGPEGAWFTYPGTRLILTEFDGTASYGALVKDINGSSVDIDQDSIYIPDQNYASITFYQVSNPPQVSSTQGERVPVGQYDASVFLSGYDNTGEAFLRTIDLGAVQITD